MRIHRLELDGIGPFEKAVFDIPPPAEGQRGELVFFEGPNGCGKTTIAQAIAIAATSVLLGSTQVERFHVPSHAWKARHRTEKAKAVLGIEHGDVSWVETITDKAIAWGDGAGLVLRDNYVERGIFKLPSPVTIEEGWGAYAFQGRQTTPVIDVAGPKDINALSHLVSNLGFGDSSAAKIFGQLLTNIDYARARAIAYAHAARNEAERQDLEKAGQSRAATLARFERAFSRVLDRKVEIHFSLSQTAPRILFDGEAIPLDLLGEGMRSTMAWLADLLVRLELTPWTRTDISSFEQDFWLILDEVEVNLHPRMQARLFPALRELFPNARIYATVHSPFAVAAAGEGVVFSIRPDRNTRRVHGAQECVKLKHGQSLSWVVEEVFDVPSMFLDEETRQALARHERDVNILAARKDIDWPAFLETRRWLMGLNDEVAAIVAMREVPVQRLVDEKLRESGT